MSWERSGAANKKGRSQQNKGPSEARRLLRDGLTQRLREATAISAQVGLSATEP